MRQFILAAAALAALTAPAFAQLKLNVNANDPVTGLAPADREQLVGHILNARAIVGDPGVLVVSSLPVPVTVTCDKWEVVGPNVYKSVQGNPAELKPFSVTYIKTKDFDGYCKQGVVGHYAIGKTIVGKLTSSDGSFTSATTILFSGDDRNK
jgi:hypothetical protein